MRYVIWRILLSYFKSVMDKKEKTKIGGGGGKEKDDAHKEKKNRH